MKHAQSTGEGRVYDETTHQWVEASEAPKAKAARRAKAKPEPEQAPATESGTAEDNQKSTEE